MGGLRREFDRSLAEIDDRVASLFSMLAEDLPGATTALLAGAAEVPQLLVEREQAIDCLWPELEQLVVRQLLRQAPVAWDLRFLLSVLRIAPEIERSHDLVMDIGSRPSRALFAGVPARTHELTGELAAAVTQMWRQAADAWRTRDRAAALPLTRSAEQVHGLHASLITELGRWSMPQPLAVDMVLIARDYDRLGAHALNVARRAAVLADR